MRIANIDPMGEIAIALLRDAGAEVRPLYTPPAGKPISALTNDPPSARDLYVAAFVEGLPVGSGALRELDRTTAEVRRMYVRPEHRRKHVAHAILEHLIASACRLGYERLIVETGNKQAPAIAFYENYGFRRIEAFGEHVTDETSLCYEFHIDTAKDRPSTV